MCLRFLIDPTKLGLIEFVFVLIYENILYKELKIIINFYWFIWLILANIQICFS
jgi:hypothetical protein